MKTSLYIFQCHKRSVGNEHSSLENLVTLTILAELNSSILILTVCIDFICMLLQVTMLLVSVNLHLNARGVTCLIY